MKANFGHTEGASGIAQLIKTVMILERGIIPPIAELKNLNPKLKPDIWNFEVGSRNEMFCRIQAYLNRSSLKKRESGQKRQSGEHR